MKKATRAIGLIHLPILIVLGLTGYFTIKIWESPLIGLEVKEANNQWIVEKVYKNGWASNQSIEEGDVLELVDGERPEQHSTVTLFNRVEMAKSMTILDENLEQKTIEISYDHLGTQYIIYLIIPFIFNAATLSLSLFLYRKRKNDKAARILIYFLLSMGITYLSASVSARGDLVGRALNIITLLGSLILFIHFLKNYLLRFNLLFIKDRLLASLYVVYSIVLVLMAIDFNTKVVLFFFFLLLGFLFFQLIKLYLKFRDSEGRAILKLLGVTLLAAFSPFVLLYVLPNVFFDKNFVSAEVTAIFLIIIPIAFVYLQLAEQLFDIEYIIGRLRYYSLLAFPFAIFIIILLSLTTPIQLFSSVTAMIFLLLYVCTTLFLYVKEVIDYKVKHHLFSKKNDFEMSLYKFFQKARYETKVESLLTHLMNEIQDVLAVKKVRHVVVKKAVEEDRWVLKNSAHSPDSLADGLETIQWEGYDAGSLYEIMDGFGIIIGGDHTSKDIILFGMKNSKTNLNVQEKIWLETLAYFSSILLENFQLIEGLFDKIEHYQEQLESKDGHYPHWLARLTFSLSEKERAGLATDLHDSVLQDQLHILRKVEMVKKKVEDASVQQELNDVTELMLDNIHLIRETCHELLPPFLTELGVIQSIQNYIDKVKLRCNFLLKTELDPSIQIMDAEYALVLYRVVQELLNNAMKHSLASKVNLSLCQHDQKILLTYEDNGKGMEMTQLHNTFQTIGILGMKERIKSVGGTIDMVSAPGQGIKVMIEVKVGN
ncbi:sensor histidine kinase [Sporosarcina sp. HYO08]|uniref:sensor histidine kinase n=1 Tax=Sporosarcina sp. HYO08 TaxID=1759557 RepID=UPI000798C3C8|nr:ATP-binding protein [Sporosarcina sp. HYO08]KXH78363.1 hypothetical protein AU377_13295 [Sporosarcina sp. HYO08]